MMDTIGTMTGFAVVDSFTVDWTTGCLVQTALTFATPAPTTNFNHDFTAPS